MAAPGLSADAEYLIPEDEVVIIPGEEGLIGRGALGEVRKALWCDTEIAVKDLFMLRDDPASAKVCLGMDNHADRSFLAILGVRNFVF